jgi:protein O-mannosyl-transferase
MPRPRLIGLLLALVTLLVYLPVTRHGFLVYDDDVYITGNPLVQKGLTRAGIQWAFTTSHASNWHPLTWLSHMADCELFGLNPGAHHVVNALFHAANAALLFALLLRLTGGLWPSAFVAALFAWHPLHVESVAWISERKDVLSTCFALLSLLAYAGYVKRAASDAPRAGGGNPKSEVRMPKEVRNPNAEISDGQRSNSDFGLRASFGFPTGPASRFYWLALFLFALGLMSKPMVVTLPFVMLLLDYWPLQRFRASTLSRLTLEKWPLFLLTAVACVVTYIAQSRGEAVMSWEIVPPGLRLENALTAYVRYLLKTICPTNLAVIYPLAPEINGSAVIAAAAVLIFISIIVWRARQRSPYGLFGWLWFLGTLVPVIGLVQVGGASLADRYTYFPLIGVFVAVTFAVRDLAGRLQLSRVVVAAAAAGVLAACLLLTENQLRYWRDSETLFRHALAVTRDSYLAHLNLGTVFQNEGRLNEALVEYREAARLFPGYFLAHSNLGSLLDDLGRPEEALAEYRLTLQLKSNLPALHDGTGIALVKLGRADEAMREFAEAARLDPAYPWPYFQMGKVLLGQGHDPEAVDKFREALRISPDNYQILAYTARVLAADENPQIRDGQTALAYAARANVLSDNALPFVLDALGMACAEAGRFDDAQEAVERAMKIVTAAGMKQDVVSLQQRLRLYQNHQPWRESFLSTNARSGDLPPN